MKRVPRVSSNVANVAPAAGMLIIVSVDMPRTEHCKEERSTFAALARARASSVSGLSDQ